MKLTSHIKYLFFSALIFSSTELFASDIRISKRVYRADAIIGLDTIPARKKFEPEVKKQKPDKSNKPEVKEVPKARPMPKPKVVGPKIKPVKIIKPKVKPKM